MGKILDTFRPADPAWVAPTPAAPIAEAPPPAIEAEPEEVPFIEIGPRRKIVAASPGVLAIDPPAPALPRPHGVAFRSLERLKPRARFAAGLVAYHAPDGAEAAAFRELQAAVVEAARTKKETAGVLLFTAVRGGIGTTTTLLNLAITAAASGRRVVVVDANLRRPAVAAMVDLPIAPGLAEVLAGECKLTDAVRATGQDNLFVLSSGAPAALWADVATLRGLGEALVSSHDLVFLDGPVWDGRSAALLAAASDVLFLVTPAAEAEAAPTSELVVELPKKGVPLAGCVLTAVPVSQ